MKERRLVSLTILLLAALLSGCERRTCNPPVMVAENQLPALSKSLQVDAFLDATLSMQGFIVPGTASRYQQTLPLLESTVERGWPGGQVAFYKFGTIITELPDREYLKAQRKDFYDDSRINKETFIQNVIDQASTEKLTLIVTDLFQSEADVNLITNKIKEKYLAKNLAVGVLAIKSEFGGKVYDVGPNNYTFDYYSNNGDPATFRPFYVLALGNHADISNYFEVALSGGLGSFSETQTLIFSRYLTENLSSFKESVITDISKLQEVANLLPTDTTDERVAQFKISDSSAPRTSFTAKLVYKELKRTMPAASPELEAEVSAFTCGAPGSAPSNSREPQPLIANDTLKRAFEIKDARLNQTVIEFNAEIVPAFLQGAGIYCFDVVLRPQKYEMPAWVTQWNMDSTQVEAWKPSPKQFNGALTFNLKAFLTNIWATTLQLHQPKVAEFYCYVQMD